MGLRVQARDKAKAAAEAEHASAERQAARDAKHLSAQLLATANQAAPVKRGAGQQQQQQLLGTKGPAAAPTGGAVRVKGLVPHRKGGLKAAEPRFAMNAVSTTAKVLPATAATGAHASLPPPPPGGGAATYENASGNGEEDDDEPPPIF